MNTNQEIKTIIQNRKRNSTEISSDIDKWEMRYANCRALGKDLSGLSSECRRAVSVLPADDATTFQKLADCLAEIEREQLVSKMQSDCSYALEQLNKLEQRFNRETISIAVAGMGRCGKSTALKSLIGQSQEDNSTIPSGSGPAITAGKSTICCVATEEEEKTLVRFHTIDSFLNELVNPLLQSIGLPEYECRNANDFSSLNFNEIRDEFKKKAKQAADAIGNATDALSLEQAKAYAVSFTQKEARLNNLQLIINAFPFFEARLTGGTDSIPLDQTRQYVSYPDPESGAPAICYAVKECRIYSRFPNNDLPWLELTDLPGLGTSSLNEKKCFLDGLNYSVDLALMIRRPEGLFQNFTTDDDTSVMDVLGKTFGANHLHECMVLFQNDANLPQSDVERAYQCIEDWNAQRGNPLKLIRGDASDSNFMQKTLLPDVISFISKNLPALDRALTDEIMPALEKKAGEFDKQREAINNKLLPFKREFKSNHGANAVIDIVNKLSDTLMNRLSDLMDFYNVESERHSTSSSDAEIEALARQGKEWVNTQYDPDNQARIEEVKNSIRSHMSAIPFANQSIHAIRIHISEVYSELEKVHESILAEMRESVAKALHECFPGLLSENAKLEDFIELANRTGECPEIVDAVRTLNTLEVPFYNEIYPDMRKQVFDSVKDEEKKIQNLPDKTPDSKPIPPEQQAVNVLRVLRDIGITWIWKAENMLYSNNRINDIICAALERFQDRMIRNCETRRELVSFVDDNWSDIREGNSAYSEAVRTKLEKILK